MKFSADRREAAAAWFAVERRVVMSIEERAAFDAWREDPENLAALNAMHALWDEMAALKGEGAAVRPPAAPRQPRRRLAAIGGALAASLLAASVLGVYATRPLAFAERAATVVGEQRSRTLPDGSVVNLNVATRIAYRMHTHSRDVRLEEGQALFVVQKDKTRPFLVRVGDYEVRAVGTAFDVRFRDGDTQVAVQEGVVLVSRATGPRAGEVVARLTAGQKLDVRPPTAPASLPPPAVVQTVAVQDVAEWRLRTVAYEDASVAEVVADLNRFFPEPITVEDRALAARRVTLRLQISDRDSTLHTLDALLGEDVEGKGRASPSS